MASRVQSGNTRKACGSGCRWHARARALLNDPKILLLDEPFSNVDIHSAADMVRLLANIRAQGKTIFLVTHQAALLEGAADEFVWMKDGLIVGCTRDLKPPEGPN